jgi:hypothetical protein
MLRLAPLFVRATVVALVVVALHGAHWGVDGATPRAQHLHSRQTHAGHTSGHRPGKYGTHHKLSHRSRHRTHGHVVGQIISRAGRQPNGDQRRHQINASQAHRTVTSTRTVSVPSSIDASGSQDVTQQLNDFIARTPDDTVIRFPTGAHYRVEDVVSLLDKHHLTLDGNGATLFETTQGYRERCILSVVGGSDITIRGFHLRGANPMGGVTGRYVASLEAQHGIWLHGPERVLIDDNTITDVWGDFVYLGARPLQPAPLRAPSRDVTVVHNTMTRNGRQGIALVAALRVRIADNKISDVRRTVFDMEPNNAGATVADVTIENNLIGTHRLGFVAAWGRGSVNAVRVADNTLVGGAMNSSINKPLAGSRRNWTFVGNKSDRTFGNPAGAVVIARGVEGIAFRDNVQPMERREPKDLPMSSLRLVSSCGGVASGNVMGRFGDQQLVGDDPPCGTAVDLGQVALPAAVR